MNVTNENAASGGAERETAEHAKKQAPLELRALNRCVTKDDYESIAISYSGVARAKTSHSEPLSYRNVDLYIIPEGGGVPSEGLKTGLADFLEDKRMVNDILVVKNPEYVTIDIEATIYHLGTYVESTIGQAITGALDEFFAYNSDKVDFGRGIYLSDLYRLLDAVEGVDHVDLDKIYRVPVVISVIGELDTAGVFSDIEISATTKEETWTVIFTDSTHFNVTGSVSGDQINTGTVDVAYVSDGGEVTFTINSGVVTINTDDKATFKVSKLVGNITLSENEFPQQGTFTFSFTAVS